MNSLSYFLEHMVSDDRVVGVVGKNETNETRTLFKGTALDAYRHRKTSLKNYMYRDVIDIAPATIHLSDDTAKMGLKVVIYCQYGFKD